MDLAVSDHQDTLRLGVPKAESVRAEGHPEGLPKVVARPEVVAAAALAAMPLPGKREGAPVTKKVALAWAAAGAGLGVASPRFSGEEPVQRDRCCRRSAEGPVLTQLKAGLDLVHVTGLDLDNGKELESG